MACECIAEVNAKLAEHNAQVHVPMFIIGRKPGAEPGPRVFVETIKLDEKRRGKPPALFATFCPFCGIRYEGKEP
jgi:hypothetical protein